VSELEQYARAFGIKAFYPHQVEAFESVLEQGLNRACLYYPTGKGKTKTALVMMALLGQRELLVIAPPSTHMDWVAEGISIGIAVRCISHAKFRQPKYNVPNADTAIIVDEFHLLGGRGSDGWKKFDRRIAPHLRAPFIICSATPSYNDAERVYCVHHVLDPQDAAGGYAQYQLEHCLLEVAYRGLPNVVGFKDYGSAAEFLEALPGVYYMEDTTTFHIEDTLHTVPIPDEWTEYNFDSRTGLLMHSLMTRRISWQKLHYLADDDSLRLEVYDWLLKYIPTEPTLIYCDKTTIAGPVAEALEGRFDVELLTGKTTAKRKAEIINDFRAGRTEVLVATATLATGTDGLDKVCDRLLIVQDTQDDSLRRQLVGRILPRGDADDSDKEFYRLQLPPVPKK
jgi:superfamily II DNA or RNA helicase